MTVAGWGGLLRQEVRLPPAAREYACASLGLLALAVVLFRGAVFGGRVLFERDIATVVYPQVEAIVRCLADGSWPLWDRYRGFGQPLLADPSAQIAYPFSWLELILPAPTYYTSFVVAHLVFSGLGLFALARRWGVSPLGAFVAGGAWITSGPFLSLANVYHLASAAWIPWVVFSAEVALDAGGWRRVVLWGGAFGLQIVAGSADMVAMTLVVIAVGAAIRRVEWRQPVGRANRRLFAIAAAAGLLGLALSAVQWLPTLAVARQSVRFDLPAADRTTWSLHPLGLLETLLRFRWNEVPYLSARHLDAVLGYRAPFLRSLYAGVPLLALGLGSAAARRSRLRTTLVVVMAGALLVALGRHAPAYGVLVTVLPPLRILRFPVKAMVIVAFTWSLLAGIGLDAWARPTDGERSWMRRVALPVVALAAAAVGAAIAVGPAAAVIGPHLVTLGPGVASYAEALAGPARRLAVGAVLAALAALAALGRARGTWAAPRLAGVVALLAAVDLLLAHGSLHATAHRELLAHRPAVLDALSGVERVYVYDYSVTTRARFHEGASVATAYRLARLPEGWSPAEGLALGIYEYLNPPTGERWGVTGSYDLDLLGLAPTPLDRLTERLRDVEDTPAHTRLLRLGAVQRALALRPAPWWRELAVVAEVPGWFVDPIRVLSVPDPVPRTYAVGTSRTADGDAALAILSGPDFDPHHEIVIADGPTSHSARFSGTSRIATLAPDRVTLDAALDAPGFVVLVDAYDPGWRATVDGAEARLLRANMAFRAVAVPAGRHTIEMVYRPRPALLGLAATLAAALVVAAAAVGAAGHARRAAVLS